ncbi:transcriptional regulator CynR [Bordetella genomosp. 9]|uniref:Transcriptional regulator CynR n=1 Tax=Bordetella genomosp. 9 TaxID=1416803 RepID=A0A1W6YW98_9BORD|nr:transcriptional regulator CynR [Bordetella genomosp. 9]ARP85179.1 transcriptional regulator CynR [Bordetella genomosp. 9]ARP89168.1 transcriptional regulator CynR [Bordetella genomosp. 9]
MNNKSGIKLRQLEYFLAIAETLHFSKAAEKLYVTQPTLSHQLAELEAHLGKALFDRSGKHIRLTQVGEVFHAYAKRTVDELAAGLAALDELDALRRGQLNIGVSQSFMRKLLPPVVAEFMRAYPAIRLNVTEMMAPRIEAQLAAGELHLGIAFVPPRLEDTEVQALFKERLMLVVGKDHRLAARKRVRLADLAREPLVLMSRDYYTRALVEQYFEQRGLVPNIACETNALSLMMDLAGAGAGVATLLPESAIDGTADVAVVPVYEPVPTRVTALLWSRRHHRTAAATAFASLLRARFQPFEAPRRRRPAGAAGPLPGGRRATGVHTRPSAGPVTS